MATETVKLHGGNADGRWHKVPRGATMCEARGSRYELRDGAWHVCLEPLVNVTEDGKVDSVQYVDPALTDAELPKPAPRKRRTKPKPAE